ncbi:MAG: amidohydrolase family protein [Phenylobacterium sp.]|uniref:amidohydrolase family protein n=1 Tax=Phenylobacterium sp. TaxID=1871053 RepID=UPI00271DAA4D|nr:amidohydrolase family protein [Phenylobacterium sp.]MDO8911195.1 amidohydrolase family protein [Phenylobacterium sp.]
MIKKPISADSHITEPPHCYVDYIDPKFRNRAPRMERLDKIRDAFVIEGLASPIPMGLVAAAGKDPSRITTHGVAFEAYNRWLREYCGEAPDRLYGLAQVSMRTPEDGVAEILRAKEMGFKGVMMPGNPAVEDYDSTVYDKVWAAAVECDMPLSFHTLTGKSDGLAGQTRGPRINGFLSIIRGCQDVMGTFIFGGVFDRFPGLKVVCVEADAGWVPHNMYRMDHAYKRPRYWMKAPPLERMPSEYFRDNIYVTFQDDWVAFGMKDMCNVRQLMWANDFPHSDSTWPLSQTMLGEHTKDLREQEGNWICHENVAELYGIAV